MEEASEENSVPKPHTDEQNQVHSKQLGLGFQSSPSTVSDSNLEHNLPNDNLDQQTTNDEHRNQRILETLSEEIRVLVLEEKERENEKDNVDRVQNAGEECIIGFGSGDDVNRRSENGIGFCMGNESVGEEAAAAAALVKDGRQRVYHYLVRPDAEDCAHYLRTGTCKFGRSCKFNHQRRMKYQPAKENMMDKEENMERPGLVQCKTAKENMGEKEQNTETPELVQCKYYLSSGGCVFGKACKYHHGRGKILVAPIMEFKFLGLPIRLGEKDCPYYMRNGSCKYESNCWFNHPDPSTVGGDDASSVCGNGGSGPSQRALQSTMFSRSLPRAPNETVPFVPMAFSQTQKVPPLDVEWNGHQVPAYPTPERRLPMSPAFTVHNSAETNFLTHHNLPMLVDEYPERPGQPECAYFLKTGDCKYRSACKFHHPKYRIQNTATFAMSEKGLPLRPDQNVCSHYYHYGICKFGPVCKYDHPVKYSRSSSSTASGPGIPYHSGKSATTNKVGWRGGGVNGRETLIR